MTASACISLVDARLVDEAQVEAFSAWLSNDEMLRYGRFVRRERQRQFVIGRVLARQALGQLLGVTPRDLSIMEVFNGAPVLAPPQRAHFSISHSGPWVACAVSMQSRLGLDIEVLDPTRDIAALAQQAFDAQCCAALAQRPEATRVRDFYLAWSAHEARIKLAAEPASTFELDHPELSVVLCSGTELARPPKLGLTRLTAHAN